MRLGGFCVSVFLAVSLLGVGEAMAAGIANWNKSARSWNNSHMTTIKAAMEAAGHQVLPDAPITEKILKSVQVLVIAEPTTIPTVDELLLVKTFVNAGGLVLLFGDTGIDRPTYNGLLAGIGSSITYTTTTIGTTSALQENQFTVGPTRVVGSSLSVTSGNGTAGGTLVDNNYIRYDVIGAGLVFAFGDRIDHNDVISATNSGLLLNIVAIAIGPAFQIPTLSATAMMLMSLLVFIAAFVALRRRAEVRSYR